MADRFHAFCGIGIHTQPLEGDAGIVVTSPYSGNPAEAAGIKAGDIVTAVMEPGGAWQPVRNNNDAVTMIRGLPGTEVTLKVQDPSGQLREISITRQIIVPENIDLSTVVPDAKSCGLFLSEYTGEAPSLPAALPRISEEEAKERA